VLGELGNELRRTNPIVNIREDKVTAVLKHFGNRTSL
jgi:hypothetical protein